MGVSGGTKTGIKGDTAFDITTSTLNDVSDRIKTVLADGVNVTAVWNHLDDMLNTWSTSDTKPINITPWTTFDYTPPSVSYSRAPSPIDITRPSTTVSISAAQSQFEKLRGMIDAMNAKLDAIDMKEPPTPTTPTLDLSPITPPDRSGKPATMGELDIKSPQDYGGLTTNPLPTPQLVPVNVPAIAPITIAPFSDTVPAFTHDSPNPNNIQWTERFYTERILPRVQAAVTGVLDDGVGLPPGVDTALFDSARRREDLVAQRAIKDSFGVFAARGFAMPPGMNVAVTKKIIDDNQYKTRDFNREVYINRYKTEVEQFRFAVQQGIAVEQTSFEVFKDITNRAFELARWKFDAELQTFKSYVEIYNTSMRAFEVRANIYTVTINAQLRQLEQQKMLIEAEGLKQQYNQTTMAVYNAGWEAVRSNVAVYSAMVQGVGEYNRAQTARVEAKRAEIEGWKASLEAEVARVNADVATKQLERTKGEIYDAELRAYGSYVQSLVAKVDGYGKSVQGYAEVGRAEVDFHNLDLAKDRLQLEYDKIGAELDVLIETTKMTVSNNELQHALRQTQVELELQKSNLDANVAKWRAANSEVDANNQKVIEGYRIWSELQRMRAESTSRLLQGILSTLHFQESASGSMAVTGSAGMSVSYNYAGDVASDVPAMTSV